MGKIYYKINGTLLKDKKNNVCSDSINTKIIKVPVNLLGEEITTEMDVIKSREFLSDDSNVTVQVLTDPIISKPGENIRIIALFSDEEQVVLNDEIVSFKIGDEWLYDEYGDIITAKTINGLVNLDYILPYDIKPGTYDIYIFMNSKGYKSSLSYAGLVVNKLQTYIFSEPLFVDYGEDEIEIDAVIKDELNNNILYPVDVEINLADDTIKTVKAINGLIHTTMKLPNVAGMLTLAFKIKSDDIYYESEFVTTINIDY